MRAAEDGILFYPVYALLFVDAGLSTAQISTLFMLWSVVSFAFEVPSGAWADTWSRRRLFALGSFSAAAGYASWTLWPAYPGFVLGFLLWGLGGALSSGTLEALVYDELAAVGATEAYPRIIGRGGTAGIVAMLGATLLAAPAYALGGYPLVGALSVASVTAAGVLALGFPERPRQEEADEFGGVRGYLDTLRSGLREVRLSRRVGWAVAIAALVPGFTALDEYLPLLSRQAGASNTVVPLMFALVALAMAVGSALAGRWHGLSPARLALLLATAAVLLAAGALICAGTSPADGAGWAVGWRLTGMVPIAVAFGVLQFSIVLTGARLQDAITGPARTTVLSISGFASEVFAVLLYGLFGAGGSVLSVPVVFALCAVPLLGTAVAVARRSAA